MKKLFAIFAFMLITPTFAHASSFELPTNDILFSAISAIIGIPLAVLAIIKIYDRFKSEDLLDSASDKDKLNFEKFKKESKKGNSASQNEFGYMYQEGNGVVQDFVKAEKWFRKSAKQGNKDGQNNLALIYENYHKHNNKSLIKLAEVENLYLKSAEQGNWYAKYNLGRIYENGIAVVKNDEEAYKWYKESAAHNYRPAIRKKDALEKKLAKKRSS